MKILIDARVTGADGIGRYTRNLLKTFEKQQQEFAPNVFALLLRDRNMNFGQNEKYYDNSRHYTIKELSILTDAVRLCRPDVLHCTDYRVPFPETNVPIVVSIHDIFRFTHPLLCYANNEFARRYGKKAVSDLSEVVNELRNVLSPKNSKICNSHSETIRLHEIYYAYMLQWAVISASVILVPTRAVEKSLFNAFGDKCVIKVIPYGVNHPEITPSFVSEYVSTFKNLKPYILYVGQNRTHKNVSTLLTVFKKLIEFSGIRLVLAGKMFSEDREIRRQIENLKLGNRVIIAGYLSDLQLSMAYRHAEALVHLSAHEGFGFTPLEALLHGTRVIVSDIPVFRETLGEYAIYVDERDGTAILDAISFILNQPDNKNLQKMRVLHAKKYSWDITAQKTLEAYHTALDVFEKIASK